MAEEAVEQSPQQAAEQKANDFIFGKQEEESPEEAPQDAPEDEDAESEPEAEDEESAEASDETAEDAPEEDGDVVEVEWEGQILEAPKSIAEALMRNKDYTEKTQQLSTRQKELDIRAQQFEQAAVQQQFAESIKDELMAVYEAQSEAKNLQEYLETNVKDLGAQDFQTVQVELKKRERVIAEKSAELEKKYREHQQAVEQSRKELRDKSTDVLRQKIPNWGEEQENAIREYALSQGITEQVYGTIVDPLEKEILYKAMQYDRAKANSGKAVKSVKKAPTIKPKSRKPMPKQVGDKLNLRKKLKNPKRDPRQKQKDVADFIGGRFNI